MFLTHSRIMLVAELWRLCGVFHRDSFACVVPIFFRRGEEGTSCFEYLMAHGARYNQQSLEELGAAAAATGQDD
jgi:hypothetical protein